MTKKLDDYTILNYTFKSNLYIDAYILLELIKYKKSKKIINVYIQHVHDNWELYNDTINVTKWIYSLIIATHYTQNINYLNHSCLLILDLISKYDNVLEVFITLHMLLINLKKYNSCHINSIENAINSLNISHIDSNNIELSQLLLYSFRLRLIIHYAKHKAELYNLYDFIINDISIKLRKIKFNTCIINNDGYKWFNLCIGLEALNLLDSYYDNNYIKKDKYSIKIKQLLRYLFLKRAIIKNFETFSYKKGNWKKYKDLNIITYINLKYPSLTF